MRLQPCGDLSHSLLQARIFHERHLAIEPDLGQRSVVAPQLLHLRDNDVNVLRHGGGPLPLSRWGLRMEPAVRPTGHREVEIGVQAVVERRFEAVRPRTCDEIKSEVALPTPPAALLHAVPVGAAVCERGVGPKGHETVAMFGNEQDVLSTKALLASIHWSTNVTLLGLNMSGCGISWRSLLNT